MRKSVLIFEGKKSKNENKHVCSSVHRVYFYEALYRFFNNYVLQ